MVQVFPNPVDFVCDPSKNDHLTIDVVLFLQVLEVVIISQESFCPLLSLLGRLTRPLGLSSIPEMLLLLLHLVRNYEFGRALFMRSFGRAPRSLSW